MEPFVPTAASQAVTAEQQQRQELDCIFNAITSDPSDCRDARVIELVSRWGLGAHTQVLAAYARVPGHYTFIRSPIAWPCSTPVLNALLAAGASPNATAERYVIDSATRESKTARVPVLCASLYDPDKERLSALLAAGADPKAGLELAGLRVSALTLAIWNSFTQPEQFCAVVEALLRAGADPNGADDLPLAFAAAAFNRRVVQLLLEYGATPSKNLRIKFEFGGYKIGLGKGEDVMEYLHRHDPWDEDYGLTRFSSVPTVVFDLMCDVVNWEAKRIKSDAPDGAPPEQHAASRRAKGTAAGMFANWSYAQRRSAANYLISLYS